MEEKKAVTKKEMSLIWAITPLIVMILAMVVSVIKLDQGPHIPLIIGTSVAAIVAWKHGFKWVDIEEMMYKGIKLALPAIVIIILVGIIIGAWIGGGVVASMIYYGLKIITPAFFLVTICVICMIVSLAIGSSWSTMGTIGVAGMGIGLSMGIPAAIIAGAVISGAYFGDKMSPLSDTTNLAAGLTGTDLFVHIRHMLLYNNSWDNLIALAVYGFLGTKYKSSNIDQASIDQTVFNVREKFCYFSIVIINSVGCNRTSCTKVPAIPALLVGIYWAFYPK